MVPVLLSGASEAALRAQAERLLDHPGVVTAPLAGLGVATVRRAALAHRAVVLAGDAEALTGGLERSWLAPVR